MADEIKTTAAEAPESRNFIHTFIEEDIAQGGQFEGMTVHTRFPPEPNGYLHIGHCKALTIDFGTAEKFGGLCNLRMDDTNPTKEDEEFVEAIKEDIHWLGFDWGDRFFYGSDYFEEDYRQAVGLIKKGLAYVCELSPEEFRAHRGDIGVPATSPYRDRPVEESLDLFARMRAGEFPNGDGLRLTGGIVGDGQLDGPQNSHHPLGSLVQVLPEAVLQEAVFHHVGRLGHADAVAEITDGPGGVAPAAQTAESGHPGIVPAGDPAFLH